MDGGAAPTGSGGSGDGQRRDFGYAENMRKRMSDMQQELMRERKVLEDLSKPYVEVSSGQVRSALGGNAAPGPLGSLVLWLGGITTEGLASQATTLVSCLAGVNGRELESRQAEAVVEHLTAGGTTTAAIELGVDAAVLAAVIPRWNNPPASLSARPITRFTWPLMLLIGYSIPAKLFVEPIGLTLNARYHAGRFREDPRMAGLNVDIQSQLARLTRIGWDATNGGHPLPDGQDPWGRTGRPEQQQQQQQNDNNAEQEFQVRRMIEQRKQEQKWPRDQVLQDYEMQRMLLEQQKQRQQQQGQQQYSPPSRQAPSDAWSSSSDIVDDIEDDASPVAPSMRGRRAAAPGDNDYFPGSSWDRLRQQTISEARVQRRQQQQQQQQARGGWDSGSGGDSSSSQDYTYSSSDYERSTPKEQAQREFDSLLDQERKGVEQSGGRWSRG